ncbi:vWA domain-containing protein [Prosthecomicrobium sp. N25]|uniref:vWA domain-containing protein n=1 Tax=Prosthecomicrobium sp. N25 TaxID=3129254 RepID=UPI00307834AD
MIMISRAAGLAALALAAFAGPGTPAAADDAPIAPGQAVAPELPGAARVEVVFVLDTTGSMSGLIDGAKKKIWGIADEIRKANPNAEIRLGLVGYRDRGDLYVTTVTDLTSDIHAVYGKLIEFRAQGGGDWPESVNEALNVAVTRLAWTRTPETRRIVFLVGDAPPHMDYAQDIPFTDTLKIAERDSILVNAVQAGAAQDTALVWRTIASLGRGRYIPIPQSGGVVVIETPYDQQILQLQLRLNSTVLPYGPARQQYEVHGKLRLREAAPAPAASDMASFLARAAPRPAAPPPGSTTQTATLAPPAPVITGEGDLVADVAAGRADPSKIKREELAPELRDLSEADRKAAIEAKVKERKALQDELDGLVAKRDAALATERAKRASAGDGFDEVVQGVIRDQVR